MSIIARLSKHILTDGFHIVVDTEQSHGSWVVDKESGKTYLDCYSQFASQPLGWNSPYMNTTILGEVAKHKIANSDMYSEVYCKLVEQFSDITPDFQKYFFIDGGALAVENALKAAFDWKCQLDSRHQKDDGARLDVVHLKEAFHGRTGYTLSLTNTGPVKTKWFPKFPWTRVTNPKIHFPIDEVKVRNLESIAIDEMEKALATGNVAAIIMEPIQGEGGDNHFRPEFFREVRRLADMHQAMLIFDEVQTGLGLTGKMWSYEHFGVVPDLMCFGKKTQVCGFCSTDRINFASDNVFNTSGRINSTWGGNIVDMARATMIFRAIKEDGLIEQAAKTGDYFLGRLRDDLGSNGEVTNVRGRGLMIAFDLPSTERRDEVIGKLQNKMLALKSGSKSIRFRPCLTFDKTDVDFAITFIEEALS